MISRFRFISLLSYFSIASVSAAIITPALPIMQAQFMLPTGEIEWVVSSFLLGYVFGQLIYGPLANRVGRLRALRVGLLINLIGVMLCLCAGFCSSFELLIIGRFISALGAASGLACTYMLVNEWLPEPQRKSAMAYAILSFTLGIGVAVTLGGLITEYWLWQGCFVLLFVQGLVMFAGTHLFEETLKKRNPVNLLTIIDGYKAALLSPSLIVFSLAAGFSSAIGYCFSAAAPQIANESLHLTPSAYGYWNGFNMVGMLTGGLLAKQLLGRFSAKQVMLQGLIASAAGIVSLIGLNLSPEISTLWFFATTMCLYLFSGLVFASATLLASGTMLDKASGSSMMSFINMMTATLCVMVMGYLRFNPLQAFTEIIALMWLIVFIALLIYRQSSILSDLSSQ